MYAQDLSYTDNILAWCQRFVEIIITFCNNIAGIFNTKVFGLLNPFSDIPVVGDVVNWLLTAGGLFDDDWTLLQLMFGAGVYIFFAFVIVKFVLDIIF